MKISSAKRKVLLVSHAFNDINLGAARVYICLHQGLVARNWDADIVYLEEKDFYPTKFARRIQHKALLPRLMSAKVQKLKLEDYDLIMCSSGMIYPIFKELSAKSLRPVLVNHVHGLSAYDYATVMTEAHLGTADVSLLFKYVSGPLQIRWDELGFRYSDINILQNKRDLSYIENKGILNVESHIIPPAIIDPIYNAVFERNSVEAGPPSLFWFGSWENRKGAQYLPDAFRRIRERFPDCRLKIGGTGMTTEKILSFFDATDCQNISVLGSISDEEHLRLLSKSTVFLFPSLSEGFGLALLEAASQGLPAVTVSTGFAADYLRDGVSARIVYPSSLHIAEAVIDLLADPALRTTISENARSVARHFSNAEMVSRYEDVFSAAIARRKTRQIAS